MICFRCQYRFVLDPKESPYCADREFIRSINVASDDGTRWYTPNQLHGVIFRRRNRGFFRRFFPAPGSWDLAATQKSVRRWWDAGRDLRSIVHTPVLDTKEAESRWPEPDLFDYGAEAILAVDDRLVVDLLVRNQVHTNAKAAIVDARNGYPSAIAERLKPLVTARPDLPIFLLHSSRADAAASLERDVRNLLDASENPVIDLGLGVDSVRSMDGMRWARRVSPVSADMLPHRLLTDGVAAAIANRVALEELMNPPKTGSDGVEIPWLLLGDHDGDFG